MPCYILRAGDTDMVKIGWADQDVEARRSILQTAHWLELTIIRVIEGEPWIERGMHRMFAARCVRGEWFRFHEEMLTISVDVLDPPISRIDDPIPILYEIEKFCDIRKMSATRFGIHAAKDPQLVHDIRRGRECKRDVRLRIRAFISAEMAS